jgi:hypothetical protein
LFFKRAELFMIKTGNEPSSGKLLDVRKNHEIELKFSKAYASAIPCDRFQVQSNNLENFFLYYKKIHN